MAADSRRAAETAGGWRTVAAVLIVFAVLLAAYVRTLMPGTVGGDAGELQYAAPLLALVHPTGQPLYVLLGKLWTAVLPFGEEAYRMNLLAAVSAALAGASLTWLTIRLTANHVVALVAGLVLGLGGALWGQAVIADKYAFTVLLAVWICGLALWWGRDHAAPHADRLLYALSAAFGIGLLHHRSLGLFAAGIGVLVLWQLRGEIVRRWQRTLVCAALVIVPALVMYPTVLPLLRANDNSPLMWQPDSAAGWVDFLLERHVLSDEVLVFDDAGTISEQLALYRRALVADHTPFVALIALGGVVLLARRRPVSAVFMLVSFGLLAFFSANFRGNERQFTYYLPSFVVLAYAFALGADGLTRTLKRRGRVVVALALLAIPFYQMATTYPEKRLEATYGEPLDLWRQTLKTGDMGRRLASGLDALPDGAVLAADWEQVTILWYEQNVAGRRPDVTLLYPIERYADFLGERPVCLARHVLTDPRWIPANVDALICLEDAPRFDLPDDIQPINTRLTAPDDGREVIELTGYRWGAEPAAVRRGTHIPLTLYWQALVDDIGADWSLSLRVLSADDWSVLWMRDIGAPVMGLYATSRWAAGEIVADYHELTIPPDIAPGRYLWAVVAYRQVDGDFVSLRDPQDGINILGGVFDVIDD